MSDYTGHVDPGGAPSTRTLEHLTVTKLSVGPMDNNAYLLVCRGTGDALLIDAAADPERLTELLESGDTRPQLRTIVTTHQHRDHWQALAAVAGATDAEVVAHPADAEALPVPVTTFADHGTRSVIGDCPIEFIHLRGHTPGSLAVLYRDPGGSPHLFTGDSLFPGGPGKTGSPADFASLMDDLQERVFGVLPDETWVYPGHGDDTTLGRERPQLATWRQRGW